MHTPEQQKWLLWPPSLNSVPVRVIPLINFVGAITQLSAPIVAHSHSFVQDRYNAVRGLTNSNADVTAMQGICTAAVRPGALSITVRSLQGYYCLPPDKQNNSRMGCEQQVQNMCQFREPGIHQRLTEM